MSIIIRVTTCGPALSRTRILVASEAQYMMFFDGFHVGFSKLPVLSGHNASRGPLLMGTWFISLSAALFVILIGLYIHWSVVLAGALLPFVPLLTELLRLRQARRGRGKKPPEPPAR